MRWLGLCGWVLTAACGPEFPQGRVLERARVLAVALEPPEAGIGEPVAARVLVAAPEGSEAPAAELWQCPLGGRASQGCVGASGATRVGDDEGTVEAGEEWRGRVDAFEPYDVYLVVTAAVAGEGASEEDVAIKRLVLDGDDDAQDDAPRNTNPALTALLADVETEEPAGEATPVAANAAVRLVPVPSGDSVERYLLRRLGGGTEETDEVLSVSYYTSCGTLGAGLSAGASLASSWTAPDSGACTVWAILRDGRGGTDWRSRRFVVTDDE